MTAGPAPVSGDAARTSPGASSPTSVTVLADAHRSALGRIGDTAPLRVGRGFLEPHAEPELIRDRLREPRLPEPVTEPVTEPVAEPDRPASGPGPVAADQFGTSPAVADGLARCA